MGSDSKRLRALVEALCAPGVAGRAPGTPEGIAARNIVRQEMTGLGLKPVGEDGFDQPIPPIGGASLLGAITGSGERWIVVGAHYDHLGSWFGDVYPGANDNASGVAVMLEAARQLIGSDLDRNVLIAAFDSEEPPHFLNPEMGSQWFVDHPTAPLDSIDLMICLDVVGHSLGDESMPDEVQGTVFVQGAELCPELLPVLDHVAEASPGVWPRRISDWVIPPMSDHHAFREAGIPFAFYTCARSEAYHMTFDTPDRLDFDKMAALADHIAELVYELDRALKGPLRFDIEARDDLATVRSLTTLLTLIGDAHPAVDDALAALAGIAEETEDGSIGRIGSGGAEDRVRNRGDTRVG